MTQESALMQQFATRGWDGSDDGRNPCAEEKPLRADHPRH